jgi:hypothetical protein
MFNQHLFFEISRIFINRVHILKEYIKKGERRSRKKQFVQVKKLAPPSTLPHLLNMKS